MLNKIFLHNFSKKCKKKFNSELAGIVNLYTRMLPATQIGRALNLEIYIYDTDCIPTFTEDGTTFRVSFFGIDFKNTYDTKPRTERKRFVLNLLHNGCLRAVEHWSGNKADFEIAKTKSLEMNLIDNFQVGDWTCNQNQDLESSHRVIVDLDVLEFHVAIKDSMNMLHDVCWLRSKTTTYLELPEKMPDIFWDNDCILIEDWNIRIFKNGQGTWVTSKVVSMKH